MTLTPEDASGKTAHFLDAALTYSQRGLAVVPAAGKRPRFKWKRLQRERPSERLIRDWFSGRFSGISGIAVFPGRPSGGLPIRDFDREDAYRAWAEEHPRLANRLPTVKTARGHHVWGRLHKEAFANLGDGELRGDAKHPCLLPPSTHPSGTTYAWTIPPPDGPLPLLPRSLTQPRQTQETQATQETQQHIACVPSQALPLAITEAIRATLPGGFGQRNRKVFDLARRLKGIPGLSPAALKAVVSEWHRQALSAIRTKPFAETWQDFQIAWLAVKVPHGAAVMAAYEDARRSPLPPIDDCAELGILAALCRYLAGEGKEFFLSCRTIEDLFSIGRMTAWRWLQTLRFYRVIEPAKIGTLKDRHATEYRYVAEGGLE
jgi:hypothetical protein